MKTLLTFALVAFGTAAAGADDYREITASHELGKDQAVRIEFHSGDVRVEASTGNRVEIELSIECKWGRSDCEDVLDRIKIDWRSTERHLFMRVEGLESWRRTRLEVDATIQVPAAARLAIEMGAGSLEVEERTNDVRIELGAGEVRVWMAESAVETVSIDVGVGDAKLRGPDEYVSGRRSMLIGSEVFWDRGSGKALVDVEVGAGEATVWLE